MYNMDLPNILFVETTGQKLTEIHSGKKGADHQWQSLYINTPEAALDIISQRRISLIVASFGADLEGCKQFFQRVREQASPTIQFILLLENINDQLTESVNYVHLCISDQCSSSDIISEIQRGLSIWKQIQNNESLASLLLKLNKLPTPPALYFDLRDELDSSNCSTQTVANIISRDQAITVKLLKVVNSGFYGLPRSVVELNQAISLLGIDLVLGIVLSAYLFDSLPLPGLNLDKLWKHNLTVSALAKHIASEQGGDREIINASGIAGLLHDLGSLILLANLPTQYHSIIRDAAGDETVLIKLEYEQFGAAHPEIGALALRLCNISDDIIDAVASHHLFEETELLASKAVFQAEQVVNAYTLYGGDYSESFDRHDLEQNEQVEGWWKKCAQIAEKVQA